VTLKVKKAMYRRKVLGSRMVRKSPKKQGRNSSGRPLWVAYSTGGGGRSMGEGGGGLSEKALNRPVGLCFEPTITSLRNFSVGTRDRA